MPPVVIAIDGPAASGKSSTAARVASQLQFRHLDSGSLYRAITAVWLERHAAMEHVPDAVAVLDAVARCSLMVVGNSIEPAIDGEPAGAGIRSAAVNSSVSAVAQLPEIRAWVDARLREVAEDNDVVVDGRDMGSAVFPHAVLKVFLVADPWERARRRLLQRLGRTPSDDEIAVETEALVHRDAQDANQSAQARDAILIDTTHLTQQEQVDRITALARAAMRDAAPGTAAQTE
jgi:cytidylate kinase